MKITEGWLFESILKYSENNKSISKKSIIRKYDLLIKLNKERQDRINYLLDESQTKLNKLDRDLSETNADIDYKINNLISDISI